MKKLLLISLTLIFGLSQPFAQSLRNYIKADEYKQIFKRTLAVEMLEENEKVLKKLEKKKKKNPGAVKDYKKFIKDYNAMMKEVVQKYWTVNEKIEFKSTSEIKEIRKNKNKKYVCLFYLETERTDDIGGFARVGVPTFAYCRAEVKRLEYKLLLPVKVEEEADIKKYELIFSLRYMQANMEYIQKTGKKINPLKFANREAEEYCSELSNKTLLVNKKLLGKKASSSKIRESYPHKFKLSSAQAIDEAVINEDENFAYTIAVPSGTAKGSIGPLSMARVTAMRLIVDAKTGHVLAAEGTQMGDFNDFKIRVAEFGRFAKCK